jgi:hypothetical protein
VTHDATGAERPLPAIVARDPIEPRPIKNLYGRPYASNGPNAARDDERLLQAMSRRCGALRDG